MIVSERAAFWAKHVACFEKGDSKTTKAAYCRENNITYANFCAWHRKLSVSLSTDKDFLTVSRNGHIEALEKPVLPHLNDVSSDIVSIVLKKSGHTIRFPTVSDPSCLRSLIRLLEE